MVWYQSILSKPFGVTSFGNIGKSNHYPSEGKEDL